MKSNSLPLEQTLPKPLRVEEMLQLPGGMTCVVGREKWKMLNGKLTGNLLSQPKLGLA